MMKSEISGGWFLLSEHHFPTILKLKWNKIMSQMHMRFYRLELSILEVLPIDFPLHGSDITSRSAIT